MSAKEAYKRSVFHIETLPDELLIEVLRHATWVSYEIAPSDLVVKRFQSTDASTQQKEYMRSLVTKRYLIRVCKKWYRLAYMFLYEWIFVGKLKNLPGLVLAIEQLGLNEPENRTLIGWYTKRLDIDIRLTGREMMDYETYRYHQHLRQRPQESSYGHQHTFTILRLLRSLDNLEVLTVGKSWDHTWLNPSFSHSWCPRLRIFNWVYEENLPSKLLNADVWVHFLRSHPHIVGMKPSITKSPTKPLEPLGFTHPLLTYNTGYMSPIPINATFTSLRRLSLNLHRFHIHDPNWEDHFMTNPLPSLTVLQLNLVHYHGEDEVDLNLTLSTVRSLMHRFMPGLRRIELVLWAWPAEWSEFSFPETVEVLGIRVCSVKPSRKLVKFLLQKLNKIVQHHGSGESLMIHFLDRGTVNGILTHEESLVRHARKEGDILKRWIDCDGYEYKLPVEA